MALPSHAQAWVADLALQAVLDLYPEDGSVVKDPVATVIASRLEVIKSLLA